MNYWSYLVISFGNLVSGVIPKDFQDKPLILEDFRYLSISLVTGFVNILQFLKADR